MLSTQVRSHQWLSMKEELLQIIRKSLDLQLEAMATQAIADYMESESFAEDACEYCRDMGWKEPD